MSELSNQAPEVRPKRPFYRSYGELIRVLTTDAINRVKADKHQPIPPLKITAPMRTLAKRIMAARTALKTAEREMKEQHKAYVPDRCERDNPNIPIEYSYEERHRLQDTRPASYQERLDKIKRLRVKATLDTIDMSPRQAKAYLLKLERELAAV